MSTPQHISLVTILSGALSFFGSGAIAERLSFYGTSGLVDMPSADALGDGRLAFTTSNFGASLRNTLTFQISPRVQGAFRYSILENYGGRLSDVFDGNLYDRSFDLHFSVLDEGTYMPAVAIGLRDFGGTGIYSSEYVVATKNLTPTFAVTAGLGWGRLGERNPMASPLTIFGEQMATRPDATAGGISETGQLDFDAWFRGDVALFGGVEWQVTQRLSLVAEYSSDLYSKEVDRDITTISSPINAGVNYRFDSGVNLGVYSLYGSDVGVMLSYTIDPAQPMVPGGAGAAPLPISPRNAVAAASWNQPNARVSPQQALHTFLEDEGFVVEGISISALRASVHIENTRFPAEAQAIGRAARIMANSLDPQVQTFEIVVTNAGVPMSSITLMRTDLEELEFALDGAWQSYTRAQIADAWAAQQSGVEQSRYPTIETDFGMFFGTSLFDPDQPVRLEYGLRFDAKYSPRAGVVFEGQIRAPLGGDVARAIRVSNSVLPHVRSDTVRYSHNSGVELSYLTGEYFYRPAQDVFGRMTVGYLERMYGGISAELLWHPINSRLALGAEVNYVVQRDFDLGLGFQDYSVATGHASAYYDFGNGYHGQLDVGRYLAGDWGATVSLDREFNNGFKVGAFFTLTDVPFEEFGEGSFDKGIRLEIPIDWLTGLQTRDVYTQLIRPVYRDGGARLDVRNRLYTITRNSREPALANQWGRFTR